MHKNEYTSGWGIENVHGFGEQMGITDNYHGPLCWCCPLISPQSFTLTSSWTLSRTMKLCTKSALATYIDLCCCFFFSFPARTLSLNDFNSLCNTVPYPNLKTKSLSLEWNYFWTPWIKCDLLSFDFIHLFVCKCSLASFRGKKQQELPLVSGSTKCQHTVLREQKLFVTIPFVYVCIYGDSLHWILWFIYPAFYACDEVPVQGVVK